MDDKLRERLEEIRRAEKGQNAYSRSVLALVEVAEAARGAERFISACGFTEQTDPGGATLGALRAALAKLTEEVK